MTPQLITGIAILVVLFGGMFAAGARLIGLWEMLAVYGIVVAIGAVSLLASYLIVAGAA